jgi:ubiquinone biosynthesis protein
LARLSDGTEVAVKVQRPELDAAVARDLRRVRVLAAVLERSGAAFIASPRDVAEEIAGWLRQELDFRAELSNLERLYELTGGSSFQRVPRPFPAYSTQRVLTMEYLSGIPVSSVLQELRAGRLGGKGGGGLRGVEPGQYARQLLLAVLTQVFRHQFFHADLHPGNLLVLPGNVVGFVDFGLCDELPASVRESQFRYFAAVYSGDAGRIFKALTEVLIPGERTDLERFRLDFVEETRHWEERRPGTAPGGVERSPLAQYLIGVMRAARRNGLEVPARVLSMYRALLTAESVAARLGGAEGGGLREAGAEFFRDLQREETVRRLFNRENAERLLMSVLELKQHGPGQVAQILSEVSQGSLVVKTEMTESTKTARVRNQRARALVLAVLSVSVALLLTRPGLGTVLGIPLAWPLSAALVVLYLWSFLLWRKL